MNKIDKLKLAVMSQTEQLRAEFEEFFKTLDPVFREAILDAIDGEQQTPEMMVIVRMAKLLFFETMLQHDPPGMKFTRRKDL
jgi:hypothetical protein